MKVDLNCILYTQRKSTYSSGKEFIYNMRNEDLKTSFIIS